MGIKKDPILGSVNIGDYVRRDGVWHGGWVPIPYPNYARKAPISFSLAYLVEPGFINFRGSYERTSGSPVAAAEDLFQLPSNAAQLLTNRHVFNVAAQGSYAVSMEYNASANWMRARGNVTGSPTWVTFDNVRLPTGN